MRKLLLFVALQALFFLPAPAQKKPLDHTVYDGWQHIGERMISPDGRWIAYTIDPQEGDNELVVLAADDSWRTTIPRGYTAQITEDSRYLIFRIKPFYRDTREAKIRKKKPEEMPKDSIGILELGTVNSWKMPRVKSYKLPQQATGNTWLAYQVEKLPEAGSRKSNDASRKTTDSLRHVIDSLQQLLREAASPKKKNRDDQTISDADGDETTGNPSEAGADLVLRKLATKEERIFPNVLEYYFSKSGNKLLIEQGKLPNDSTSRARVLLFDLLSENYVVLAEGNVDYKNFAMTDNASRVAYVAEAVPAPKELVHFYTLWYYDSSMNQAKALVNKYTPGLTLGMTVSEYGQVSFSKNGNRLFFGLATLPIPRDTAFVEFDHPKLDLWHYKDDYLQTVQTFPARLKAAQQQQFLSVVDLDRQTIRQLANPVVTPVLITNEGDGNAFIGTSDMGKRIESQWNGYTRKDIYAIDVRSGDSILVRANLYGTVYPSSTGKYILWYDKEARHYFSWDGANVHKLTETIPFPLWNEEGEVPDEPNPFGIMGWHENDSLVYIYDRYDVWAVDPSGEKRPALLNAGMKNRARQVSWRYVKTNPEERFIRDGQELLFRQFDQRSKKASLFRITAGEWKLQSTPLLYPAAFDGIQRAKNSSRYIFTKEDFIHSPDLYTSTLSGPTEPDRILSHINPQQSQYNWGTAELVQWKAYDGKEATGILYKPEDFDPAKKYPMIVYFYEKLSDGLYDYKEPAPIRSAINVPFFVSRGYLVFYPDIHYTTGHPGKNAYDYIVSGTRALIKKGWVDSSNLALQGHSWGGYQAAQLATMTKLYKAVWAGAPVANMTSAYGGIRWESGANRQFQYEKTQSRIGATLWEKRDLYIENSPLFHLDKVTAPMVIMANDADGAVPWYQGIELFTGLRRLGKKVWMFNYNGQGHGLTQRQDMRDYQIRMQQFFDWILKGAKPASWIIDGLPAVKKGKEFGLELID